LRALFVPVLGGRDVFPELDLPLLAVVFRDLVEVRAAAIFCAKVYFGLRRQTPAWDTALMDVTAVVLAGGLGSRIGGDKALVPLGGRPLINYAVDAASAAGLETVVVAKRSSKLPPLDVPILLEPDSPVHPLLGVITALEKFPAVIALPCDMPFIDPQALAALAEIQDDVATLLAGEPFPALYRSSLLPQLREALQAGASVRSTQAQSSGPAPNASMHPGTQLAVNTPEDLLRAEMRLRLG
jgi:molybdopterin-guanine dinucleotide biosynthesis protein A